MPQDDGHRCTNDNVLYQAKRPPIMACVRLRRLRYLVTALEHGPTTLLALLEHTWERDKHRNGWASQLRADFQRIRHHIARDRDDPIAHRTIQDWIDEAQNEPKKFCQILRQAWDKYRLHQRDAHH
eukprot:748194-Pyramimonas_sp.AAC.1